MTTGTRQPTPEKLPANIDHAAPVAWSEAQRRLEESRWYWLATLSPAGTPHVRPVLAVMLGDTLYFVSNAASRKARNLRRDAHCTLTSEASDAHLVVEGTAAIVRDEGMLQRVAEAYASKYRWHVRVIDGAFDADCGAPTAGPPPYDVYALTPKRAYGFGIEEPWSPTRWRF